MTEHGHNFIREIAEAYRALEAEAGHLERIKELEAKVDDHAQHAQRVELKLIDRHSEIADLQAKLRSVEAERDEATFREMAASDKSVATRDALQLIREAANEAIVALTGSAKTDMVFMAPAERREWEEHKAARERITERAIADKELEAVVFPTEPLVPTTPVEPAPIPPSVEPASAVSPTESGELNVRPTEDHPESTGTGMAAATSSSEGERAEDPTASPILGSQSPIVSSEPALTTTTVSPGPYYGKLYIQVQGWVSRLDWLAGGGTNATYDWREGDEIPAEAA